MKVREIRTYITWGEPRNWVFVKVLTDTELYGWGEGTLEGKETTVEAAIHEIGASLIDKDPTAVEHHWQALYRHGFWRGGVVLNSALAALDQAMWDLRGKAWGVPVYRLLGGPTRERIRLYTHVGIYQAADLVTDAKRDMADGFTAFKTGAWAGDAHLPEAEMTALFADRVASLRSAAGPGVDIMFDNHGRSRPSSAFRLMKALEPHGLLWLEEPTQPDDMESLSRLRAGNPSMDLATGERLFTKWDFAPLIERRLVDIVQPDLCHAGGITECKKIAALAESRYVQVAPHSPQGPISTAAAAHLGMAIPNFLILEFVRSAPYRDRVLKEAWPVKDGHLTVPDRPGLGVELDEEALAASPRRDVGIPRGAWHADGSVADV
ncbi:MAG: galactonate dehydratase [candidate division Zixibacteria bacterium]|nr:galactonate dehydratase [candidate division Zixibacteria bacterium]